MINKLNFSKNKSKELNTPKKSIHSIGIKSKLIVSFLLLSVLPLVFVAVFSYTGAKNTIQDEIGRFSEQLINQTAVNISSKIDEFEKLSIMFTTNSELLGIISKDDDDYEDTSASMKDDRKIEDLVNTIAISSSDIKNVIFLSKRIERYAGDELPQMVGGKTYFNSDDFLSSEAYKTVEENAGRIVWITGLRGQRDKVWLMSMINNASNINSKGMFIMGVDASAFGKILQSIQLDESASLDLLDTNLEVITSNRLESNNSLNEGFLNSISSNDAGGFIEADKLINFSSTSNGWKLVSAVSVSSMMSDMYKLGIGVSIVALLCILIAVFLSIIISASISNPIKKIKELMKKAELGNLTVAMDTGKNDEIGKLTQSFNSMVSNICKLVEKNREVTGSINNDTIAIRQISEQSAASSQQVSSVIQHIASSISDEASAAERGFVVISGLSKKIQNITEEIDSVMSLTTNAKDISKQATSTIALLNDKTQESSQMSIRIKDDINLLNTRILDIIKFINVIRGISDQTNLLSLNAAIEAARAGDAGKGFAVVAEEIRKLSEQTNQATKEITEIIQNIQNQTANTVDTVNIANEIFKHQENSVHETDLALRSIIEATNHISKNIEKVSTSIKEVDESRDVAMKTTEEIAFSTKESACSIQEVMASSEEQAATAVELANLSYNLSQSIEKLKEAIGIFKVA